jgi:hypothetical protein
MEVFYLKSMKSSFNVQCIIYNVQWKKEFSLHSNSKNKEICCKQISTIIVQCTLYIIH